MKYNVVNSSQCCYCSCNVHCVLEQLFSVTTHSLDITLFLFTSVSLNTTALSSCIITASIDSLVFIALVHHTNAAHCFLLKHSTYIFHALSFRYSHSGSFWLAVQAVCLKNSLEADWGGGGGV
jgi:hypothetical protein